MNPVIYRNPEMSYKSTMDTAGAMIAFHLSVPYGSDIVKEEDVYKALKQGRLDGIDSPAKHILVSLSATKILRLPF